MAKLYFRYGAMGSSKSANILMVRYNYEERGQYAVLLKPRTDNRDGEHEIQSRIGLAAPAEYVDDFLKEISEIEFLMSWVHADSPNGRCIRIIYENGDFEIIGDHYVGSFDSEGNVKRFIGVPNQRLENLIDEYLYA